MQNTIQNFLDDVSILKEVGVSTVRMTKKLKRSQLGGRTAIRLAAKRKDPLYIRYQKFRKITLDLKKKLMKKYGRKGLTIARKTMS